MIDLQRASPEMEIAVNVCGGHSIGVQILRQHLYGGGKRHEGYGRCRVGLACLC